MTVDEPFSQLHARLEKLVINGDHAQCREELIVTIPNKLPREWASTLGELAFRIQLPIYTLKSLHRFIYPENTFASPATDREKVVYASALFSLGANKEALEILSKINTDQEPAALFYGAGAHFYNWDYEAGAKLLQKFIHSPGNANTYRILTAQVNLAAAWVALEKWEEATTLLNEIVASCLVGSYKLLLGNCYELQAQVQFYQSHYDKALEFLALGKETLRDQQGLYSLFVDKWILLCEAFLTKGQPASMAKLQDLRIKALEHRHWNTIRECDLFEAILTQNMDLIRKVILGTPSVFHRQRARKLFGKQIISRGHYLLAVHPPSDLDTVTFVFDPYNKSAGSGSLVTKPRLLSLFDALTQDFYQPCNLGFIFQQIYPDEKFNPFTSPKRVLESLRRLNQWFLANQCPLRVNFKKSEFQLSSSLPVSIVLHRGQKLSSDDGKISQIKKHFAHRMFSTTQLCEAMGISRATANRIIAQALDKGVLIKDSGRTGRIYRFPSAKIRKAA